jgi:thioredoxin-related protein
MKNIKILFITGLLIMFAGSTIAQSSYTFNEGLSLAKSNNKKVLIAIYIDADSWCEKMQSVYSAENIKNYINNNFVFIKLNAQGTEKCTYNGKQYTAAEIVKIFGATGYPTHVFLNSDGSVIKYKYNGEVYGSYSGYVEASEFERILKYFATNQYKDTDLSKVL